MTAAPSGYFLQAGPFRTHYLKAGAGPPLVLLHGLGGSAEWWQPNIGALARMRTVFAPDLPGHGLTDKPFRQAHPSRSRLSGREGKPRLDYTLPLGRAFLLDFLGAIPDLSGPADIVGHSTGGLIALDFALAYPEKVGKLVLADSAGLGREAALFLRLMTLPILGELLAMPRPFLIRALLRRLFYDRSLITPELVGQVRRERADRSARHALLSALRHGVGLKGMKRLAVLTERLPRLQAPALLLWGVEDRILPFSQARRAVGLLPSLRLHPFPRCGHVPNMEKAEEFNRVVAEFLERVG